jgi:hypothetical protein
VNIEIHSRNGGSFSWSSGKENATPTRMPARRPAPRDMTGDKPVNEEMLRGLYHGDYRGLQFASPLAFTPIARPVSMMGLPTPTSEDERTQEVLDEIVAMMADRIPKLHRTFALLGTAWRWPRFDIDSGALVWEELPDSIVSDILVDLVTGRPGAILTDEQIAISIAENQVVYIQRKRRFDPAQVTVRYFGQKPQSIQDFTARNVAGILPCVFAHDADEGEIRGHSALARIIRDLKDYHDIDYRVSEILTKFLPKQVQSTDDVGKWCENNLGTSDPSSLVDYDVAGSDLVINRKGEETDYKHLPEEATAAHEKTLERKYYKIIEGSGIPELFWGPLATGNHASTETDYQQAIGYVEGLRRELDRPYHELFAASLRILSIVRGENYQPFEVKWNLLESVSAETKSKIFQAFAAGVSSLAGSATITKPMLYKIWKMNYPESTDATFEEFIAGMEEMAIFKQFVGETYGQGLEDFQAKAGADAQGATS